MITLDTWLPDIRIEDRVYASAATIEAWMYEREMCKRWSGIRPHKVMVF